MNHALEIRFDQLTEKSVRSIWNTAAETYGTRYMFENNVIPHMTLLVGDGALGEVFSEIDCPCFEIRLSGLGFFADGRVAYIPCEIPRSLFDFHRQIYETAMVRGAGLDHLYAPDHWVPHCTIAVQCERNLMRSIPIPEMRATVRSLVHITYPPTKLIVEKLCSESIET